MSERAHVEMFSSARTVVASPRRAPRNARTRARYLVDVAAHLVLRSLSARYRSSLLGWVWALAPPLAQLVVFYFVFTSVIPTRVDDFVAFLFIGIVTWSWFATSLTLGAQSLETHRDLATRPGFPRAVLPVVAVATAAVDYLIALPVLVVVVGLSSGLHAAAITLPVLLVVQFLLTVGIVWTIAPINVFFRDVGHLVGVVLLLGFFLTPVFYSREQTPARFSAIYDYNPIARLIEAHRGVFLDGELPASGALLILTAASLGVAGCGLAVFTALRHRIPEQL